MNRKVVLGVSGGPDSVYLLCTGLDESKSAVIAHVNHGARGKDSDRDQEFVKRLGKRKGVPVEVRKVALSKSGAGFEARARNVRGAFLREVKRKHGAEKILLAHTADDQVETVLMRVLEGAGISGLKGIPRRSADGIERPLLGTWREEILKHLNKHKIPYRVDKSNFDTRFERNWVRHVLIPLLEKRYGKSLKKRIFALGERFREIDEFLDAAARRWIAENVMGEKEGNKREKDGKAEAARRSTLVDGRLRFQRKPFGALPSALRKKILQIVCFERVGIAPNERLLESLDRVLVSGGPSARQNIGKGAVLRCRYDQAVLDRGKKLEAEDKEEVHLAGRFAGIVQEAKGRIAPAVLKDLSKGEQAAVFDADKLQLPLGIRQLVAGDRIRPFGMDAEKKVKEILIDRKVPREERWGRPVVCDANGTILWIPGVVRSALAPVTEATRRSLILRTVFPAESLP
ncbi:MAG: tRNA lysidine(34) synthetase TilS [Deltaproteobacteria bacterium]|nr:tRNA lysidine(34) synthetase TilS [Deltaproteobacteria bacterium]PWB61541.1 MAG: tRNA lysidine(34) synthetase TilS [Deltaproteobacteria bacterium]